MLKEQMDTNDQSARDRIKHDLGTTFLVEAGAGSGKTTSLVDRMLQLIATGTARMGEIAAITFTKKAASELQGRFRMKLEREWRCAPDGEVKERYRVALEEIGLVFMGTIHSFCGQLLRERPIEAGVDPAFRELDETEAAAFRDRCWDEYVEQLTAGVWEQGGGGAEGPGGLRAAGKGGSSNAGVQTTGSGSSTGGPAVNAIDELAELGVHVEELRGMFHRVSQYEDVDIFTEERERPDLDAIRDTLFPLIGEALRYVPTTTPIGSWDTLQADLRRARRTLGTLDMSLDRNVLKVAGYFEKTINVTQKKWTDGKMAKQFKEQFQQWQIDVLRPTMQAWREFLHPIIIRLVAPAVAYCRTKRAEAGLLDFQDLLMKAAELLRSHAQVRHYFAGRYTRLFVDEFQDTDPIQAEMMLLLTGRDPEQFDWRLAQPRPGSLFVVGDPKQSIYRFRRADISTYNFVKERIRGCGDVLGLNRNFRSIHAIGDYVNYAFEAKFVPKGQTSETQAEYVRMATQQANPKDRKAVQGVFTLTYDKVEYDRKTEITELDTDRIARYIAWACAGHLTIKEREGERLVTRPAQPGDFMILLSRKDAINRYAEKLELMGIPSDTTGSKLVYEELLVIRQLVECLRDQTNRIPLLAVLRGMLFGLSDDALYHYKREAGHFSWYHLPEEEALSEKALPVRNALSRMKVYAEWVRELPALAALTRILDDLGLLPYAAIRPTGAIRAGTLVRLLALVQANVHASASWSGLADYLKLTMGTEALESTSLFAGSGNAVRIMNLHKAKGLEAPVVFLACPCGDNDHDAEEHIDRMANPAQGYFTISRPKTPFDREVVAQPVGWPALSEKEREFLHAEKDRLLYVAATRAKQLLVVSRYPSRPAIDPWSALKETLEMQLELDEVSVEPVQAEPLLQAPNVAGNAKTVGEWLRTAAEPTFARTSVTAETKSASDGGPHRAGGGGGMAFGTVVHRCLEALGTGEVDEARLEEYVRTAATEEELEDKWLPEALGTIRNVPQHEVWQRGERAKRKVHEFSFTVAQPSSPVTSIVNGVIDYLYEEEDGWVIVDFKTDTFAPEHEAEFIAYYKPQVLVYAAQWEHFGYKVKEVGLWFLKGNKYVQVR